MTLGGVQGRFRASVGLVASLFAGLLRWQTMNLILPSQAVGDLVRAVDIDQSGVSRHLRILGEAGFVVMRPDGARRLYSLQPEPFQAIDVWVQTYRKLWEGRLDRFDAALARRQSLRQGEGKK